MMSRIFHASVMFNPISSPCPRAPRTRTLGAFATPRHWPNTPRTARASATFAQLWPQPRAHRCHTCPRISVFSYADMSPGPPLTQGAARHPCAPPQGGYAMISISMFVFGVLSISPSSEHALTCVRELSCADSGLGTDGVPPYAAFPSARPASRSIERLCFSRACLLTGNQRGGLKGVYHQICSPENPSVRAPPGVRGGQIRVWGTCAWRSADVHVGCVAVLQRH